MLAGPCVRVARLLVRHAAIASKILRDLRPRRLAARTDGIDVTLCVAICGTAAGHPGELALRVSFSCRPAVLSAGVSGLRFALAPRVHERHHEQRDAGEHERQDALVRGEPAQIDGDQP